MQTLGADWPVQTTLEQEEEALWATVSSPLRTPSFSVNPLQLGSAGGAGGTYIVRYLNFISVMMIYFSILLSLLAQLVLAGTGMQTSIQAIVQWQARRPTACEHR